MSWADHTVGLEILCEQGYWMEGRGAGELCKIQAHLQFTQQMLDAAYGLSKSAGGPHPTSPGPAASFRPDCAA
uniref:Uncharacterized protein n=1 Tax=Marmota marmota marmota TaxID=9994 RepID=A0A8C5YL04_MARMA